MTITLLNSELKDPTQVLTLGNYTVSFPHLLVPNVRCILLYLQYPTVITSKDALASSKYSLASGSGKTTYKLKTHSDQFPTEIHQPILQFTHSPVNHRRPHVAFGAPSATCNATGGREAKSWLKRLGEL